MHLWTEYEGRTIAEGYTLGRLLRSEGRNGFFATSDNEGHPAVIRLTEAHFDEDEQLKRWRQVAEVHQDNLIEIEKVGQTSFDGVALTYALMEPDDANLGDVLKERPLTVAEATQVAKSVLAALAALHESGLVHEHLEPSNVLAVGEVVKLRSDCVRECVADGEFTTAEGCAELRRRDVHDFGRLLLQCLTLEKEWISGLNVPEPFRRVIPHALDGSWTLEQIAAVIDPASVKPTVASTSGVAATAVPTAPVLPVGTGRPLVPPGVRREAAVSAAEPGMGVRHRRQMGLAEAPSTSRKGLVVGLVVAAVLLVLLIVHLTSGKPTPTAPVQSAAPVVAPRVLVAPAGRSVPEGAARSGAAGPVVAERAAGWYVIAFTYNHEAQATAKVAQLRRVHNSLHPRVFSPTGQGPYFVALGGAMGESEADAVLRHARRSGLPRDTFVRHY